MILNNMKKPDLDNEISITLTERELLIINAAVRRIAPCDASEGVKEDFYDVEISSTDCTNVCHGNDIENILVALGYQKKEDY